MGVGTLGKERTGGKIPSSVEACETEVLQDIQDRSKSKR